LTVLPPVAYILLCPVYRIEEAAPMTDTRTRVDELIEESYLISLPEDAIRKDVLQFLDSCERIAAQTRDESKRQEMQRRLKMFRQLGLRLDSAAELSEEIDQWMAWSPHDMLAHRAARLKLLVLDALAAVDPNVPSRVGKERFPQSGPRGASDTGPVSRSNILPYPRRRKVARKLAVWALRVAYGILLLSAIAVFAYRFLR